MHSYRFIILLLLLVISSLSMGERARGGGGRGKGLSLALYGGFSFTSHLSQGAGSIEGATGISFGFGLDYRIMSDFSLTLDMLYNQKTYDVRSGLSVTRFNLAYLEFPVMLRWHASPNFHFMAGPYLAGLVISAYREVTGTNSALKGDFANDYGLAFGNWIGFYATQKLSVGVLTRYDYGLANIQNNYDPRTSVKTRTLISTMTLTLNF